MPRAHECQHGHGSTAIRGNERTAPDPPYVLQVADPKPSLRLGVYIYLWAYRWGGYKYFVPNEKAKLTRDTGKARIDPSTPVLFLLSS